MSHNSPSDSQLHRCYLDDRPNPIRGGLQGPSHVVSKVRVADRVDIQLEIEAVLNT
jgi:hypothetical protein